MVDLPRRVVLIGAAAAPLAACGAAAEQPKPAEPPPSGQALASISDIPVESGTVVGDTILTQPSAGVFKGFLARCTHAGCKLSQVSGNTIVCPCHGSRFALDGAVLRGPAVSPLKEVPLKVEGSSIVAGDVAPATK